MEQYIDRIKKDAEHLVKEVFPAKALELDLVLNVIIYFKINIR
jgi:hypothetical protein